MSSTTTTSTTSNSNNDNTATSATTSNDDDDEYRKRFHNAIRAKSLITILRDYYNVTDKGLLIAIGALGEAASTCSELLADKPVHHEHLKAGTRNASGDDQLVLDIECDRCVFDSIEKCGVFAYACSEETPTETRIKPNPVFDNISDDQNEQQQEYTIGFDPLDGSSIIDSNFAIGGIYGLWKSSKGLMGLTGRDQIASVVSMFGPRTTLAIALTSKARTNSSSSSSSSTSSSTPVEEQSDENQIKEGNFESSTTTTTTLDAEEGEQTKQIAFEVTLIKNRTEWVITQSELWLEEYGKIFAPGNLRASNDNLNYKNLIDYWINERYTLRYTGGMVPDIYHILIKGKGIFSNVSSIKAKAKLRLVYEVAPIGLLMECAGGKAIHENMIPETSVLDIPIIDLDQRLGVCMGSIKEVDKYCQYMLVSSSQQEKVEQETK